MMTDIIERLRLAAIGTSEAGEKWAKSKSLRQDHNTPRDDLYSWPTPEQTLYGLAAAEITRLRADRNAVIRECAAIAGEHSYMLEISKWNEMTKKDHGAYACKSVEKAILALIEKSEN